MAEHDVAAATERGAPEPGFDERLRRLEQIVHRLEEGELELEPAIEHYREGVALLKGCRDLLAGYRRQVEELGRGAEEDATTLYAGDPDVERTDER